MNHFTRAFPGEATMKGVLILVTAAAAVLLSAQWAPAGTYTFTNIADDSAHNFGNPSINDSGVVAFWRGQPARPDWVYKSSGGSITLIAESGGFFREIPNQMVGLDADGRVSFSATHPEAGGKHGIFIGDGGMPSAFVVSSPPPPEYGDLFWFGVSTMNSEGTPAYVADYIGPPMQGQRLGVFVGHQRVASNEEGQPFRSFGDSLGNGISLNDESVVVFKADLNDGGAGIYVHDESGLTTVADTNGPFAAFSFSRPDINDAGTVVFWAEVSPFVGAISIGSSSGGPTETFVDPDGPYGGFGREVSINDSGEIVFTAGLDRSAVGNGVFTGPNPQDDKVIFYGDTLFGSVFWEAGISTSSINDAGQIAFRYLLADGREGIALATPVPTSMLPGDIDLDGDVDRTDAALFTPHLGRAIGSVWTTGDFDSDGATTLNDLALQQANIGRSGPAPTAPAAAVPEPSACILAFGVALLVRLTANRTRAR
jgi:hypothetical protein